MNVPAESLNSPKPKNNSGTDLIVPSKPVSQLLVTEKRNESNIFPCNNNESTSTSVNEMKITEQTNLPSSSKVVQPCVITNGNELHATESIEGSKKSTIQHLIGNQEKVGEDSDVDAGTHLPNDSFSNDSDNSTKSSTKRGYECAKSFGFPDGWKVKINSRSRYTFRSPDGKLFYSKKKASDYLLYGVETKSSDDNECTIVEKNSIEDKFQPESYENQADKIEGEPPIDGIQPHELTQQNKEQQGENSLIVNKESISNATTFTQSNQGSLSDVIENLNKARETVARFGPIPWRGCKIVKGNAAPGSLGLSLQTIPSKFGLGIVHVKESSPLYGQVQRGDIITHFMDMPLYGLEIKECARLFMVVDGNERVFQIAPWDFPFKFDHHNFNDISNQEATVSGILSLAIPNASSTENDDINLKQDLNSVNQKSNTIENLEQNVTIMLAQKQSDNVTTSPGKGHKRGEPPNLDKETPSAEHRHNETQDASIHRESSSIVNTNKPSYSRHWSDEEVSYLIILIYPFKSLYSLFLTQPYIWTYIFRTLYFGV